MIRARPGQEPPRQTTADAGAQPSTATVRPLGATPGPPEADHVWPLVFHPIIAPDLTGLPRGISVDQHSRYVEVVGQFARVSIEPRPSHCDRGHYVAKLGALPSPDGWKFELLNIEPLDGWTVGRYYMKLERALPEVAEWLADRESRVEPAAIARLAPPEREDSRGF